MQVTSNPEDQRYFILNPDADPQGNELYGEPYSGIAALFLTDDPDLLSADAGTGFFVGQKTLLTAQHVAYKDNGEGDPFENILVLTGAAGVSGAFNLVGQNPILPFGDVQRLTGSVDIAVIRDVFSLTGFLGLPESKPTVFGLDVYYDLDFEIEGSQEPFRAQTAGYPGSLRELRPAGFSVEATGFMVGSTGTLVDIEQDPATGQTLVGDSGFDFIDGEFQPVAPLNGELDGEGGQSGSPVWRLDPNADGAFRAMGVLVAASQDGDNAYNFLASLTEPISPVMFTNIMTILLNSNDTQPAGVTNRITGTPAGEGVLGGPFADVIRGMGALSNQDILRGNGGSDIYEFSYGFGKAIIQEPEAFGAAVPQDNMDALDLRGIDPGDVRLQRGLNGRDLAVFVRNPDTDSEDRIIIEDQFYSSGAIEQIFFDAFTVDLTNGLLLTGTDSPNREIQFGTDANDILLGFGGTDELYGNGGDDTLVGGLGDDNLRGGTENDTYEFSSGFGDDGIFDEGGSSDIIDFTDLNLGDVRFARFGNTNNALVIYENSTGSASTEYKISIFSHFLAGSDSQVESAQFADGTLLDLTQGLPFTGTNSIDRFGGTEFNDFYNMGPGDDSVQSLGGDDTIIGGAGNDQLRGWVGDDVYVYRPGFGNDRIFETEAFSTPEQVDGGSDTLLFEGYFPSQIITSRNGEFLKVEAKRSLAETAASDFILVEKHFRYATPSIEKIQFSGGGFIDLTATGALDNQLPLGAQDQASAGFGARASFLNSNLLSNDSDPDANDTLSVVDIIDGVGGQAVQTADGIDFIPDAGFFGLASFSYIASDGVAAVPVEVIIEYAAPPSGGVLFSDLTTPEGTGEILNNGASIELDIGRLGEVSAVQGTDPSDVNVTFFDLRGAQSATVVAKGDLSNKYLVASGFDGTTTLTTAAPGTVKLTPSGERFISTDPGQNIVFGDDGADVIGTAAGADVLSGGGGSDVMFGGDGDDTLIGGAAADEMTGGAGADIFSFDIGDFSGDNLIVDFITDFEIGVDQIELSGFGITGLDDLNFRNLPSGDAIDLGNNSFIVLEGIDSADLLEQDIVGLNQGRQMSLISTTNLHVLTDANDRFVTTDPGANEVFAGAGLDAVIGGDGNDILRGEGDDDVIFGGGGDDRLIGGQGSDELTGRAGADSFEFTAGEETGFAVEFVTDYEAADTLVFNGFGYSSIGDLSFQNVQTGDLAIALSTTRFVVLEGIADQAELTGEFVFG